MGVTSSGVAQKHRGNNTVTVHASKQAEKRTEGREQLLPGIPDEITIYQIAPKLPWTAFHTLSSVSRAWRRVIQTHQVYDARVQTKSTRTLVALSGRPSKEVSRIALFSIEDGSRYQLPPIPGANRGISWSGEWISLDGKLYVLGGLEDKCCPSLLDDARAEVYVLDLAGQRPWKQCASMGHARRGFGCGVKDGKIYVFGGSSACKRVCASEVYDPKEDSWSPISPVPSSRFNHKVTTVGEELFLHGGDCYGLGNSGDSLHLKDSFSAEVYDPLKDTWRIMEDFSGTCEDVVLMVGGKLRKLKRAGIQVYNIHANSWNPLQPFSFGEHEPSHSFIIVDPLTAVVANDEVLALAIWFNRDDQYVGTFLIQSQGAGDDNNEIVWQKLESKLLCSLFLDDDRDPFLCPIQL